MRLKQMLLWQWKTNRNAFLVFYLIVAAATIAGSILFAYGPPAVADSGISVVGVTINSDSSSMGSFNMATLPIAVIFLLVVGLASFAENLRVALVNGVSRRTHHLSFLLFSIAAAIVTSLLSILFDAIPSFFGSTPSSQFSGSFVELFLFFFTVYLFVVLFGYFIAGAYYRMNTPARVIVSIGVPVGLIVFFSNALNFHQGSPLYPVGRALLVFGDWMTQTLNASLFFALAAVLFLFFGWLLTRHAPIKAPAA